MKVLWLVLYNLLVLSMLGSKLSKIRLQRGSGHRLPARSTRVHSPIERISLGCYPLGRCPSQHILCISADSLVDLYASLCQLPSTLLHSNFQILP